MKKLMGLVLGAAALFAVEGASAGVRFEVITLNATGTPDGAVNQGVALGKWLKMETWDVDDQSTDGTLVFRPDHGAKGTVYMSDDEGTQFTVDGSGSAQMSGMPQMPGMTPEQIKMMQQVMEQMQKSGQMPQGMPPNMGQGMPPGMPGGLSGGQQQRVGLARSIAHNPELILADEPTAKAYEAFDGNNVRTHVLWTKAASSVDGGAELAGAFQAFGSFMRQPSIPFNFGEDFFMFDLAQFDGELLIGADEYNMTGALIDSYRLRNIREDTVDESEFAVAP